MTTSALADITSRATPVAPPATEVLDLLDTALSVPYGWLRTPADSFAHIGAVHELRDVILPSWRAGQTVDLFVQHGTTIAAVLSLYETRRLDKHRGSRPVQRQKLTEADPLVLKSITAARRWLGGLVFLMMNGRPFTS